MFISFSILFVLVILHRIRKAEERNKEFEKGISVGAYDAQSLKYTNPTVANNFYNYLTDQDVIYEEII